MKTSLSSELKEAITEARVVALETSPFLGYIMLSIEIIPDKSVPIAAVDERYMYINPVTFPEFTISHRSTILAHEAMHLALRHIPRRAWRDTDKWNIACDVVVNEILQNSNYNIPSWTYTRDSFHEKYNVSLPGLDDLTPEFIYTLIPDDAENNASAADLMKSANGAPSAGSASETYWRGVLAAAADYARYSQFGRLPAWLEREIHISAPEVTWETMLAMFVGMTLSDTRSFARPARRHLWRNMIMPANSATRLNLFVALDSSGSISSAELSAFAAELNAIIRANDARVTLLVHDAEVTQVIENVETLAPLRSIHGGGGTLFYPVTDEIYKRNDNPDGLIWLTDGFGEYPENLPSYPVLWVLTPEHQKPPWGWQVVLKLRGRR